MEITSFEIRAILKFFFVQGETARESYRKINAVVRDGAVSLRTAEVWFRHFRTGGNDTEGAIPSGRPITTDADKIIEKIKLKNYNQDSFKVKLMQMVIDEKVSLDSAKEIIREYEDSING